MPPINIDPRLLEAKKKLEDLLNLADELRRDGINLMLAYAEHGHLELSHNNATLVASVRP